MTRFKVQIKGRMFYRTGTPVELVVSLKNISTKDYYVKVVNTPFEEIINNCFEVVKKNKRLAYEGIYFSRLPSASHYMRIAAGETKEFRHRISDRYNMNEQGIYTIKLASSVIQYYAAGANGRDEYEYRESIPPVQKSLFIKTGRESYATHAEKAKIRETLMNINRLSIVKATGYVAPTIVDAVSAADAERKKFVHMVQEAHAQMIAYMEHSMGELQEITETDCSEHYQMVFGGYTQANYERVKQVVQDILTGMKTNTAITYERNQDKKYDDDMIAYTFPNTNTVFLCKEYLNLNLSGDTSKIGVLFHEWSHAIADTDDIVYYRPNCRQLAKDDSTITDEKKKASNNADSYEFFLETQFLNWGNEKGWKEGLPFDKCGLGGPATVSCANMIYVFYKNKDDKVECASGNGEGGSETGVLTDKEGNFFETSYHPETVVFHGEIYLFYIPKEKQELYYTKKTESGWEKGREVRDAKSGIQSFYPPQPVVYKNSIWLFYKKTVDDDLFMTSWDGRAPEWTEETMVFAQTGLAETPRYNPAVAVYNNRLYIFYTLITENEDQKNRIYYRVYDETLNIGKGKKIDEDSDLVVRALGELRAAVFGDSLYLLAINPSGKLVQIRMNIHPAQENRLFFTDGESVIENTLGQDIPNVDVRCSIVSFGKYNFLYYFKELEQKLAFCRQWNGL